MLRELQAQFVRASVHHDAGLLSGMLVADDSINSADRLSVYHHNIMGGLAAALGDTFSATRKLVGDDFFATMARAYVQQSLPDTGDINRYGAGFAAFVAGFPPARTLAYLAEVAAFEWAWNTSFLAEDDAPLRPDEVAAIASEDYPALRLKGRHSVQLLHVHYPVDAIWRFCEQDGPAPEIISAPRYLMLHRPHVAVEITALDAAAFAALQTLLQGDTLEAACASAMRVDTAFDVSRFLLQHFAAHTFTSLTP